jgi:hypothetical protein
MSPRFVTADLGRSSMMLRALDVMVLNEDQPEHGLKQGDLGTVVEVRGPEVEVEFVRASGRTQTLVILPLSAVRAVRDDDMVAVRPATSRPVRRPSPPPPPTPFPANRVIREGDAPVRRQTNVDSIQLPARSADRGGRVRKG